MEGKQLLCSYWKKNRGRILVSLGCVLIFVSVFFLYQLPMEAAQYGSFLCLMMILIAEAVHFRRYVSHYREVEKIEKEISYGAQQFPRTEEATEIEYQKLIRLMTEEREQEKRRIEKAYREMTEYYTTWVHQIKTPIAAMRLLLKEDTEQGWEISMELFSIERYVDMVLQYIRLGGKSADYQIAEYPLDPIIRQAVRKYARLFIRKKISLEYEEIPLQAVTDKKWLLFVIEQILANALKYTEKGKIRIYLFDKMKKEFAIEDTGIGIAPQDIPRVFESGFTGYNGRKENHSTGIGLFLCKKVMTRLSHTIRIESELGKGTRVILGLETVSLKYE